MKHLIIFIFMLLMSQYLEGQENTIIQKSIIKDFYASRGEQWVNTEKELPIFEFETNRTGDFIMTLCDTIAKIHTEEIMTIESLHDYKTDIDDCDTCKDYYMYIQTVLLNEERAKQVKGIVILNNDEIAFLMNDRPEWLAKFGIHKTDRKFTLIFGNYKQLPSTTEGAYNALLEIIDNDKVEPIWIKRISTNVLGSDVDPAAKYFDWIKNFYEN